MPKAKDSTKVNEAPNGKRLAAMHGFLKQDEERLNTALRDSAKAIAPTPIGNARNALYTTHADQIYAQFSADWDFTKTTPKWTMSSIRKVLQNYLWDYNNKKGTVSKPGPGRKATGPKAKNIGAEFDLSRSSKSGPVVNQGTGIGVTKRAVGRPGKQPATSTSAAFQPINRPARSPDPQRITSSSSPLRSTSTPSQSPVDTVLPSTERNAIKPFFDLEGFEEAAEDRAQSFSTRNGSNSSERHASIKLSDIIVAVTPGFDDPWARKVVSFPLWRCQVPVGGRDAAPEALQDWRDLSFFDFVRQLKSEEVISHGDVLIWGEYDQIVRSDMTFAGAIQEQLLDAGHSGLAFNEANFAVLKGKSSVHTDSRAAIADTGRLVEELVKRYEPTDPD